ncbi:unnamed protein product [Amoebophrya sp. A25]|nr:unnamed protein product [Amoebophrya sp. A25]|eukprot:GSA25T00017739001.1
MNVKYSLDIHCQVILVCTTRLQLVFLHTHLVLSYSRTTRTTSITSMKPSTSNNP